MALNEFILIDQIKMRFPPFALRSRIISHRLDFFPFSFQSDL